MDMLNADHYSFSTLQAFDDCPYMVYLEKIERVPLIENAFAQQGTLVHELLEGWAKGKIKAKDLPREYECRYGDMVTASFPRVLATKGYTEKTYQQCLDYFKNFDAFEGYEVIAAEEPCETEIAGRKFVGYIDLILRDKSNGQIVVCDHKSKSLAAFKKSEKMMYKQPYLYCKYINEHYDMFPEVLMFNLFKENGLKMQQRFDMDTYKETLEWAEGMINKIESFDFIDWLTMKKKDFFCTEICSCRQECANGKATKR